MTESPRPGCLLHFEKRGMLRLLAAGMAARSNPRRLTAPFASYKPIALGESCVRCAEWDLVIQERADNGVPELARSPEALGAVQGINLAKHGDCLRGRFYGDRMPKEPLRLLVKRLSYTYATNSYVRGLSSGADT